MVTVKTGQSVGKNRTKIVPYKRRWVQTVLCFSTLIGAVSAICVVDNKKGWWLDCGVRDSWLLRIKDFGGITARFDFALGMGDEAGFPHSIGNADKESGEVVRPHQKGYKHQHGGDNPYFNHHNLHPGHGDAKGGYHSEEYRQHLHPIPPPPPFPLGYGGPPPIFLEDNYLYGRSSASNSREKSKYIPRPSGSRDKKKKHSGFGKRSSSQPQRKTKRGVDKSKIGATNRQSHVMPVADNSRIGKINRDSSYYDSPHPLIIPAKDNKGIWVKMPIAPPNLSPEGIGSRKAPSRYSDSHRRKPQNRSPSDRNYRPETSSKVTRYSDSRHSNRNRGVYPYSDDERYMNYEASGFQETPMDDRIYTGISQHDLRQNLLLQAQFLENFRSPPPLPYLPQEVYDGPVIGDNLGEVLQLPATTPADTDHVPSFAAQLLVVRPAPPTMYPPGYNMTHHFVKETKLPRTKFFCEEQEFLPGLYADTQLGCRIFHLCVPAALGSTIQSFLCPNSTLFDQSVLQCNYWQLVDCSRSSSHYDANQPLALSYRRVNAAHLPVGDRPDPLTLSLLSDIRSEDSS